MKTNTAIDALRWLRLSMVELCNLLAAKSQRNAHEIQGPRLHWSVIQACGDLVLR